MKRIFVIAAMASLVLASCTKTDSAQFSANETKAAEFTLTPLTGASVKGYVQKGNFKEGADGYRTMFVSGFKANSNDSTDFFIGKKFAKGTGVDGTTDVWVGTPERVYYPLGSSDTYTFLAYSDSGKNRATWNGARQVVLEVDTAAMKYDIVASAFKAVNIKNATDRKVTAKFHHTQAWVNVTVTAKDEATEKARLTVDTIILKNVFNIGKLTLTYDPDSTGLLAADKPVIDWNFFGMCKCEKFAMPNGYFCADGSDDTCGVFTYNQIPASGDSTGYRAPLKKDLPFRFEALYPANQVPSAIEILYTVNGKQMTAVWDLPATTYANNKTWKAGSHYVYNVTIGMYEVMIKPTVNDTGWGDPIEISPIEVK